MKKNFRKLTKGGWYLTKRGLPVKITRRACESFWGDGYVAGWHEQGTSFLEDNLNLVLRIHPPVPVPFEEKKDDS